MRRTWMRRICQSSLAVFVLGVSCSADWLQFRGPNGSSISPETGLPTALSEDSVVWKVKMNGRGLSGPIVIGNKVVVTECTGFRQNKLHVWCLDTDSGKPHWKRQFVATGRTMAHPKISTAAPTPASDGKRIFATFSTNDLVCLDLDGNLLWLRGLTDDYRNASNSLGMASSPTVVDGVLVVQVESDSESVALGIDVKTGKNIWKLNRPQKANWTSPVVIRDGKQKLVVLQSASSTVAVNAATGEERWAFNQGCSTIPSSVVSGDMVFVPSRGLTALRHLPESSGPEILWRETKLAPGTASPLVYDGNVYALSGSGVLTCGDVKSGKVAWRLRLKGAFSGTPVAADGHLYFFNENGLGQVVKVGDKGKVVSTAKLGDTILCSPAIANGAIYVRSDKHIWKLAKK